MPFVSAAKLGEICGQFPTPFHLYDAAGITENARRVNAAFAWNGGYREYFAVKATPTPAIMKLLRAEGCGMDVAHLKLMAFVIGAFWAGMAGNLFAAKMTIISPSSFTFWESVVVFAVVILSGGSQIGVLLGTFLIVALPEMFRDFASARMLVFGLAMMIMMVVRPQGLLPPSPGGGASYQRMGPLNGSFSALRAV